LGQPTKKTAIAAVSGHQARKQNAAAATELTAALVFGGAAFSEAGLPVSMEPRGSVSSRILHDLSQVDPSLPFPTLITRFTTIRGTATLLGKMVGVLAIAIIAVLMVGSVCPELHDRVCHHHAGDAGADHCVISAFAAGEAYALPVDVRIDRLDAWIEVSLRPEVAAPVAKVEYRLLPACGPPFSGRLPV